ncbi:MAG TPA: carboxypeptidase-like regulatory domain-containing protein, partial [Cytophagales bacterium]|nr:carboxypeptidase-like regulatory domain-containing protein [Cytophagales bacterium]
MEIKKVLWILGLFLFIKNISLGQSVSVKGSLKDSINSSPLMGATVILSSIKDSTQWMGAVTDAEGLFYFRNVSKGKYTLKASYISHNPLTNFINVDQENVDLGTLKMSESIASLEGVTVEGKMQRVQILGDSLQFNAEAFKTNPDANVEDLVTKMPGITSQDGELKVNGEKVQQILVDGKPFFGEDPNMALKNLPAQVVDKIQVFDRQSEQSQFTGFDDGETLKTINIVTRPGMNNGVFGKLYGGYGSDDRYTAGGNINSFKGDRRISIVG